MKNDIEDFIKRRFPNDDNWLNGNCFYFASILQIRFPHLKIVYLPIEGHFMAWDAEQHLLYDVRGKHTEQECENFELLNTIAQEDDLWYKRIVRDCIL